MPQPNGYTDGYTAVLVEGLAEAGPPEAVRLPLELVDPNPANPRKDLQELDALADNIKAFGLLQPITVRKQGERYELLGGHRRRAAFALLREREPYEPQWRSIPAVVRTANDERAYLMLLSSQLHTHNWRPREEASALERLALDGLTLAEIGERLQRTGGWVSKRLRVYADSVLSGYVQTGKLAPSIAEELLPVLDVETKRRLAERAVAQHWSQDQIKGQVRALRLDRQLSQIGKLTRELLDILSSVEPSRIPIEMARDLQVLRGRIDVLSGRGVRLPSIEQAEKAAGVRQRQPTARGPRKPGYKPKL